MRYVRSLLLVGVLGTAFAVPAFAQPAQPAVTQYPECKYKTPTDEQANAAHTLYQAGKKKFDVGENDKALTLFNEAYATDCTKHELLIIIARAYELKNNKPEAIAALETYIKRAKDSTDLDTHRARVENMKKELAAASASAAANPPPSATTTATAAPTSAPTAPPPEREHTLPPWLVAGVGVVALATGLTFFFVGDSNFPDGCGGSQCDNRFQDGTVNKTGSGPLKTDPMGKPIVGTATSCSAPNGTNMIAFPGTQDGCSGSQFNMKRQSDAGTYNGFKIGGEITAIVGGVMLAGGLVWHFAEPTGPSGPAKDSVSSRLQILPVVAPGYGGIGLATTF